MADWLLVLIALGIGFVAFMVFSVGWLACASAEARISANYARPVPSPPIGWTSTITTTTPCPTCTAASDGNGEGES